LKILNRLTWTGILVAALAGMLAGCDDSDGSAATAGATSASTAPQAMNSLMTRRPPTGLPKPIGSTDGNATLSWNAPTSNTNGTALTDLSGYRIYYGTSERQMTETVQITNLGVQTYVIENLEPGTWYFAVRAVSSDDTESSLSDVVSKTIG
jgi:Fibronectin type III domain